MSYLLDPCISGLYSCRPSLLQGSAILFVVATDQLQEFFQDDITHQLLTLPAARLKELLVNDAYKPRMHRQGHLPEAWNEEGWFWEIVCRPFPGFDGIARR